LDLFDFKESGEFMELLVNISFELENCLDKILNLLPDEDETASVSSLESLVLAYGLKS